MSALSAKAPNMPLMWIVGALACGSSARTPAAPTSARATEMDGGSLLDASLSAATRECADCSAPDHAASATDDDAGAADSSKPKTQPHVSVETERTWMPQKPRVVGQLAGFEATYVNAGVNVFGSDMASSYVHDGKLVMLFGDTYGTADGACDATLGRNDDMVGTLPIDYNGKLPRLDVVSEPSSPPKFRPVQLFDGEEAVVLDEFKIPIAGFSDGHAAYALMQPQLPVTCRADMPPDQQGCPAQAGVRCTKDLSLCQPAPVTAPAVCEPGQPVCLIGGCTRDAVCVDTRSSQFDGSDRGTAASMLSHIYFGKARGDDLATYDVVAKWKTNVFSHPSVRTVSHFSGRSSGADYGTGHGDLLIWGRPGLHAEQGREARLYFATVKLPLPEGSAELHPRYFAGIDPSTSEPQWSDDAALAAPLSMDGLPNGDSHERQGIVTLTTVSWLPAPINQWVMMYGGDLPDALFADVKGTRATENAGSIVMRFAKHPWGPWSPKRVHLPAGSPDVVGDAYGPGGILYNAACKDQPNARCARSDPYSALIPGQCSMRPSSEPGRLYAPAIIDAYTHTNDRGGLNIVWAISTWLPYATWLMESALDPG